MENIREDKGYTYGPHSVVEHSVAGSVLVAAAEVATEVTAPALLETRYELGRLATLPPKPEELEQARQYALGTLQLGMSTQAGLAALTSAYAGNGLRLDFLAEHAARLAEGDRRRRRRGGRPVPGPGPGGHRGARRRRAGAPGRWPR